MDECEKCSISGDKARLFDAITNKGIAKFCERCAFEEDIPILRKPTTFQLKEAGRTHTVYERLSGKQKNDFQKINEEAKKTENFLHYPNQENLKIKKEETTLRDLVDRNYKPEFHQEKKPRPDLIDNFHWKIMIARRNKKISHEQLAKEIGESRSAIEMAEKGILPEDDYRLINKLENSLGIKLIRQDFKRDIKPKKQPLRILRLNKEAVEKLTLSDLQEIKKRREEANFEESPDEEIDIIKDRDFDEEIETSKKELEDGEI